jgi:hypothetical protein
MSWWSVEAFYATAEFADPTATDPLPTPGTTTLPDSASPTAPPLVLACQPPWAADAPTADAESGITQLCNQCAALGIALGSGTPYQAVLNGTTAVSATWVAGGSCPALDFAGKAKAASLLKCTGWLQLILDDCE